MNFLTPLVKTKLYTSFESAIERHECFWSSIAWQHLYIVLILFGDSSFAS